MRHLIEVCDAELETLAETLMNAPYDSKFNTPAAKLAKALYPSLWCNLISRVLQFGPARGSAGSAGAI
jgi:hypothetical protein